MPIRFLSLFSGIEAATVALSPLGWQCVAVAEVEPFPSAVLAYHYPGVPNLGDVTKITDEHIEALGHIDVVIGGSPCQGLSTAGKGMGLADDRSGLFHEQLRIFHAARDFCGARFLWWENVPGAFSTNKGRDFAVVVGQMAGCELAVPADGWGTEGVALGDNGLVEWAVLDAQWFGLAQRRKRVFAVLDVGDWSSRPPILLEPESMRGPSSPSRRTISKDARHATFGSGRIGREEINRSVESDDIDNGSRDERRSDGEPVLMLGEEPFTLAVRGRDGSYRLESRQDGVANALLTPGGGRGGIGVGAIAFSCKDRCADSGDVSPTLRSMSFDGSHMNGGGQVAVAFETSRESRRYVVRRITPLEACRLQGFSDNYLEVPLRGKRVGDARKYHAIGNSFAVPVTHHIGKKIGIAIQQGMGSS